MVNMTKSEVESLADFIEANIFDTIRNDPNIDNIEYLANLMSIWKKCTEKEE